MFRSRSVAASLCAIAGGVAAVAVEGAATASARRASPAAAAVLKLASVKVAIGATNKAHTLLVDAAGRPVYLLTGDSRSHPLCRSNCLNYWPAVTTKSKKPVLGKGIKGKVGVWRHDKINQVTLNGHPLYTYVSDSSHAALGEGLKSFGGTWEVMNAHGAGMAKSSSHKSGGGGYGGSSGSGW